MSLDPVWVGSKRTGKNWSGTTGRKLVLHTLEGNYFPSPQRWDHPSHFVYNPYTRELRQYIATSKAAYSIRSSDIENDYFTLQIELWGKAHEVPTYSDVWYEGVAVLVEWVCVEFDVPLVFTDFEQRIVYGRFAPQRMADDVLRAFTGIVGHCHVGRGVDTHWDPGNLDVDRVLSFIVQGDDDMIREALQAQTMAWYEALQDKAGSPGGANPGYWGSDYPGQGPNEAEWAAAEQELFTAALKAGVLGPFPSNGGTVDNVARGEAARANVRLDGTSLEVPG